MFQYKTPMKLQSDELLLIGPIIKESAQGVVIERCNSYIAFIKLDDTYESVAREHKSSRSPDKVIQTLVDMINLYVIL